MIAELGEKDGSMVSVKDGRFGVYINWKKVNAKLPPEYADSPETLPLNEAWSLIAEKAGKSGVKQKKGKAASQIELPPAPKRPKSSYLYFCAEKRPQVAQEVKSLGEISKELSRLWAETTDREPYEDMAKAGKAEYEAKKLDWKKECQMLFDNSSSPKTGKRNGEKPTVASRANGVTMPKRPKSAYIFFCQEKRPEVSKKFTSLGDISKELATLWSETAEKDEERQKYQDMAAADKKRYAFEMGLDRSVEEANKSTTTSKSKRQKKQAVTKKQTAAKKTKSRAMSAYMLFCSEKRKSIVDEKGEKLPFGETAKRLAQLWKECDEHTRARFQDQAEEEKKKLLLSS